MQHIPAGEVEDRYKKGLAQISDEIRSYWLNHAFVLGYQWLYWNSSQGVVETNTTPDQPDRIQATMNRMRANGRNLIAQLTQRELSFEVIPTMYDDATVRAAHLAETLLRETTVLHGWEVKREELVSAVLKGGTAAICVDWDQETQQTVEQVLSISEFVVEPGARDAETARWWIKSQLLPPEEVQALFGLEDTPAANGQQAMDAYHISNLNRSMGALGEGSVRLTNVLTYYERPNPLCPEGRWAVVVDGKCVQEGEWAFPFRDHLNLTIVRETVVETQWAGRTVYDDVRPVQVMLNGVWSMIMEHVKYAGQNRLVVPESAADYIYEVEDVPGSMYLWPDGIDAPKWIDIPQVPGWIREQVQELSEVIDDLMGVHDVSRGQAPANIESGYGLSILAEKDSSPVGKIIKDLARAFGRVGSMVLMMNGELVTEKKDMTISTTVGSYHVKWKGSDLSGQYSATVPLDAVLPRSRSAQMQFAKDALQMGLIQSLPEFSRLAELPQGEDLIASVAPDIDKARRENEMMAHGEIELPATFDNHELHIVEHNNFRKSERYMLMTPEERAVVDDHTEAHETMAAGDMSKMAARTDLDPRLGAVPSADGAPPAPPLPPELMPPTAPPPPPTATDIVDPDSITAEILNQMGL